MITIRDIHPEYTAEVDATLLRLIKDPQVIAHKRAHGLLTDALALHQITKLIQDPVLISCIDCIVTISGTTPHKLFDALNELLKVLISKDEPED